MLILPIEEAQPVGDDILGLTDQGVLPPGFQDGRLVLGDTERRLKKRELAETITIRRWESAEMTAKHIRLIADQTTDTPDYLRLVHHTKAP
ncbi:MAG: hypothetical protein QNI98_03540 [Woeseiaceae bacterium]|nr:hypothetical protein [Woeseiaceae bacterium]